MKKAASMDWTQERFSGSRNPGANRVIRRYAVEDPLGLHARTAALFSKTAQQYNADVGVSRGGGPFVNGKSIMRLLALAVRCGDVLTVMAEGPEASEVTAAIEEFFAGGIGQRETEGISSSGLAATVASHMSSGRNAQIFA